MSLVIFLCVLKVSSDLHFNSLLEPCPILRLDNSLFIVEINNINKSLRITWLRLFFHWHLILYLWNIRDCPHLWGTSWSRPKPAISASRPRLEWKTTGSSWESCGASSSQESKWCRGSPGVPSRPKGPDTTELMFMIYPSILISRMYFVLSIFFLLLLQLLFLYDVHNCPFVSVEQQAGFQWLHLVVLYHEFHRETFVKKCFFVEAYRLVSEVYAHRHNVSFWKGELN